NSQDLVAVLFRRLEVRDVALLFQDAGNLQLQLGSRYIHFLVARLNGVSDSRQHVCDRIGQPHRLFLVRVSRRNEGTRSVWFTRMTSKPPESPPAVPAHENTSGRYRTCGCRREAARTTCNGCVCGWKTSASLHP